MSFINHRNNSWPKVESWGPQQ